MVLDVKSEKEFKELTSNGRWFIKFYGVYPGC